MQNRKGLRIIVLLILAFLILSLTVTIILPGCGSSSDEDEKNKYIEGARQSVDSSEMHLYDEMTDYAAEAESGEMAAPADAGKGPGLPVLRIVRNGSMEIEVEEKGFDEAKQEIYELASQLKGYISKEDSRNYDDRKITTITLRLPPEGFEEAIKVLPDLGEVVKSNITTEDVGQEYVDIEARIRNLEIQEQFYQGLMERAETIEESIRIYENMSYVRQQIDQMKARKSFLDDQIELHTLTIKLLEKLPEDGSGFWHSLKEGLTAFVDFLKLILLAILIALPFAAFFFALGAGIYFLLRNRLPEKRKIHVNPWGPPPVTQKVFTPNVEGAADASQPDSGDDVDGTIPSGEAEGSQPQKSKADEGKAGTGQKQKGKSAPKQSKGASKTDARHETEPASEDSPPKENEEKT